MTPQVRILHGAPDDVELAALVAGIAAGFVPPVAHDGDATARHRRQAESRRRWRDAAMQLSPPLAPGRAAWRWSARA